MLDTIREILVFIAPFVAGTITTVIIPILIKRKSLKSIEKRLNTIEESNQLKEIKNELLEIKREIFLIRGKRK